MSKATFKYYLKNFNLPWTCSFCSLPKFSDSFFEQPSDGLGPSRINSQDAYGGVVRDLFIGPSDDHEDRIIFGFPPDMPTVDVLATVKWNDIYV